MPNMQQPLEGEGLAPGPVNDHSNSPVPEMSVPLSDDRGPDYYEAQSIKWNTARIVCLSSGLFALLSPFNEGAIDLIKVGTLEEIAGHIPTYDECVSYCERAQPVSKRPGPRGTAELLADIGL
jgi:hypothetical protein